jgi:hypothetical protein
MDLAVYFFGVLGIIAIIGIIGVLIYDNRHKVNHQK